MGYKNKVHKIKFKLLYVRHLILPALLFLSLLMFSLKPMQANAGVVVETFVQPGAGGLDIPIDLTFAPDGSLLVSSPFTSEVLQYNGENGSFIGVFAEVLSPTGIEVNPISGNVFICDLAFGEVFEVIDGVPVIFADVDFDTDLFNTLPFGIAFNPSGSDIYISDIENDTVWHYDQTGEFLGVFGDANPLGPVPPNNATFMTFDQADSNLYINNEGDNLVSFYAGTTGAFQGFFDASPFFNTVNPVIEGITIGPDGNLYLAELVSGQVARFSLDDPIPAFIDIFASGLGNPFGITFGPDGCLYVANSIERSVLRACEVTPPPISDQEPGDANGDGQINILDVTVILNEILEISSAPGNGDCNEDGNVNILDVTCVLNIILDG